MNMEQPFKDKIFNLVSFLLLVLSIFTIQNNNHNNQFQIVIVAVSAVLFVLGIIKLGLDGLTIKKICYIISLIIVLFIFRFNNFLMVPFCLVISFISFSPYLMVKAYYFAARWNLIVTFILAIVGYAPMFNPSDGVITVGFSNENSLGMLITFTSILLLVQVIKKKERNLVKSLKIIFIATIVFINYSVIDDKTMTFVFLLFIILTLFFKKSSEIKLIIAKIVGLIIPFFLLSESWLLTKNFGTTDLSLRLNERLSNRLFMWNWYYQKMGVSIFPPFNKLGEYNFWGTIDGSYTLLLLQYGILFAVTTCIALAISNYLLCKNGYYILYSIMISFEVGAFCENVLQFYTLTFIFVFSICSLCPGWLRKE